MRKTVFHSVTYGNFLVSAALSNTGPYVVILNRMTGGKGNVDIGPGSIERLGPKDGDGGSEGWHLVKYGNQRRLFLDGISAETVKAITFDFGLDGNRPRAFFKSRAWLGLVDWTATNPKLAVHYANCEEYLKGWHDLAKAEAVLRGIAQYEPPPRIDRKRRARIIGATVAAMGLEAAPYAIPSIAHADGLVEAIRDIVGVEMLVDMPTGKLREAAASLMLRDTWDDVVESAGAPVPGAMDDRKLTDAGFRVRAGIQMAALEGIGIDGTWASQILARVSPTGQSDRDEFDYQGVDCPSAKRAGIVLSQGDLELAGDILTCVSRFEGHAREILRLLPDREFGSGPGDEPGYFSGLLDEDRGGRMSWDLAYQPLRGDVERAVELESPAIAATDDAWAALAGVGPLPFLMPISAMNLTIRRWGGSFSVAPSSKNGILPKIGPVEPGAWLAIRHEVSGSWGLPHMDWPASRALPLLVGMRRAFLDAGWSGGDVWMVSFKEGSKSTEAHPVLARSSEEAVAWACASRFALGELGQRRIRSRMRILAVAGPDGFEDVVRAVTLAKENPVFGAPWAGSDRIRAVDGPFRKMPEWQVVQGNGKRAVAVRDPVNAFRSRILVFHDDLGGFCETLDVANVDPGGDMDYLGETSVPMADILAVARDALEGSDPWAPAGTWGGALREDLAASKSGWNALSSQLRRRRHNPGLDGPRP